MGSAAGAGALCGRSLVGIEAHPLIADLAATKLDPVSGSVSELLERAETLVDEAGRYRPAGLENEPGLVRKCFTPEVLTELVALRNALKKSQGPWDRHVRWALLGTLRDVATVKVGWPYQRPDVQRTPIFTNPGARLVERAQMMVEDLSGDQGPVGRVVQGDSRSAATWELAAENERFDASLTSPPYLNNFDYADATRLELYFIGIASSWAEMCSSVRSDMVIATTQQSSVSSARSALDRLEQYPSIYADVERLTKSLKEQRDQRTRGKEYNQVLPVYFDDLARVLGHLHSHTKSGAVSAWIVGDSAPYGIYVDTPKLIAALATDLGFVPLSDITVRSRGMRWRTNGTRHQVPLTERLITFKRE